MDYIDRMRMIREENRIWQSEMSEKLNLSKSVYGMYETRRSHMSVDTFLKICVILKTDPNTLLGWDEKKYE